MNPADRLNIQPRTQTANWIAPNAVVVGDVSLGDRSSVWFGAVIRGDSEAISVGSDTNIQDQVVLHADPGFPCRIGDRVTVGHGAYRCMAATVADDVMVGMPPTYYLSGAAIGSGSIVAAGALVSEGKVSAPQPNYWRPCKIAAAGDGGRSRATSSRLEALR
jgi:carbonic anhydrase/acetyltransferase-like protein (isoleucine patch superfamily)